MEEEPDNIAGHRIRALSKTVRGIVLKGLLLSVVFLLAWVSVWGQELSVTLNEYTDVECYGQATGTIDVNVTGGNPPYTFAWSATNGGVVPSGQEDSEDLNTLVAGTYELLVTDSNLATDNLIVIITQPSEPDPLDPGAHNINSISVCVGYNPEIFTFTTLPTGGTPPYSYAWYRNGIIVGTESSYDSPQLTEPGEYTFYCQVSDLCGLSEPTESKTISVLADATVTIFGGGTFCQNESVLVTSVITGGTGEILYQWQNSLDNSIGSWSDIAGANSESYIPQTSIPGQTYYRLHITLNGAACNDPYSNSLLVEVNELPAAPTSGGNQTECQEDPLQTLTATATAPAGASVVWYDQATGGNTVASPTLNAVGTVTYYAESVDNTTACTSLTRTVVTLTIHELPTPTANNNSPICEGSSLELNASGGITYYWTGPNGFTSSEQNPSITEASIEASGLYTVTVTDANGCSAKALTEVTVNPLTIPTVSILASPGSVICAEDPVLFEINNLTDAGDNPTYQWNLNGNPIPGANGDTYTSSTLANTNQISVTVTADASLTCPASTTSNTITMTVNPVVYPSVTITESANPICVGSPVTFSISESIESGFYPTYQWMVNGVEVPGETNDSFTTSNLSEGDLVTLHMYSSVVCADNPAESNAIIIHLYPVPAVTSTLSDQTYCNGEATSTITLTGTPTGVVFDITGGAAVGLNDQTGVTAISSFTAWTGSAEVTITPRANGCTGTPATYNITVNPTPTAEAPPNQTYCNDVVTSSIALTGTPTGVVFDISGGTTVGLADQTGVTAIPSFTPTTGNATIIITPRANGCEGTPVTYDITVSPTPTASAPSDQSYCNGLPTSVIPLTGTPTGVVFDISGGTGIGLANQTGVTEIPSFTPVTGNATINITPRANGCTGTTVTYNVIVTPTPTADAPSDQTYCDGDLTTAIELTGTPAGVAFDISGGSAVGLADQTAVTEIPSFTATTGTATLSITPNANGCTGTPVSFTITVNENLPVSVSIEGIDTICAGTPVTYTATLVNGGTTPSYQWRVNGSPAGTNSPVFTYTPQHGDVVDVVLTSGEACTSGNPATSNSIVMHVDAAPPDVPEMPSPAEGQANSICPVAPGLVYWIPEVPDATSYTWNFPAGWTITDGHGTTTVTVTAGVQTSGNKNITVTATNACGSATSPALVVTVGTYAYVNAGPDQTVCAGTASIQLDGSIGGATGRNDWNWSAVPEGTYSPNAKFLDATFNIPLSIRNGGTAIITISAVAEGTCPSVSDDMILTILTDPTADISISGSNPICSGSSSEITFTATPNTTVTYQVNGGANQTISVGAMGIATLNTGELDATTTYSLVSVAFADPPECTQIVTGSAIVTVNQVAVADAGPDQEVCATSPEVTLAGSVSGGATSGTWSGGTGTYNPDANTLNATYTPSAAEISAGSVTLTLTTNDPDGPCPAVSDDVLITIYPAATVGAGEDQQICEGSSVTLNGSVRGSATSGTWSGGGGTYNPNANTLIAVYTPSLAEINAGSVILTLTTNDPDGPCDAVSDQVVINIYEQPTVNAGADQTICAGSGVTLAGSVGGSASSGTWSGGSGSFNPSVNTLNAVYTPSAAELTFGSVILTLTTNDPEGPCEAASDQVTITINEQPIVNAGTDQTICEGSTVALSGSVGGSASSGTWSGGTGTYNPNANTLNATYTPSAAEITSGYVTLTLTTNDPAGVCTAVSDVVTITIDPAATVDAGEDIVICSDGSAQLNGSVGGGATSGTWSGGSGSYSPNNTTLNAVYTPSASEINARTVTLILTTNDPEGPCGTVSESINITINRAVRITTQPSNIGVCATDLAEFGVVASGDGLTYQWYHGDGTEVINTSNISGAQSNILRFAQAELADAGTYYVVVSGIDFCLPVTSNVVTLHVDQSIFITTQPQSQELCIGDNATFTVGADANGAALNYQWRKDGVDIPGATNSTYTFTVTSLTDAENYDVFIYGATGYMCSSAQSSVAVLTVNEHSTIELSSGEGTDNQEICINTEISDIIYTIGGGAGGATITGLPDGLEVSSSGSTYTISGSPTATGTFEYTVNTTDDLCNPATATGTIIVNPDHILTLTSGNSEQTVCEGTSIEDITYTIDGGATGLVVTGLPDGVDGLWIGTTYTIRGSPTTPGTYDYEVTTTGNDCEPESATGLIAVNPYHSITLTSENNEQTVCEGTPIEEITYTLGGGATGATVTGLPPGVTGSTTGTTFTINGSPTSYGTFNFTITTTGNNCQVASETGTITVDPLSVGGSISPVNSIICHDEASPTLTLSGYVGEIIRWDSISGPGGTWEIIPGVTSETYTPVITATTAFRAVVKSGTCDETYSSPALVSCQPSYDG